MYRPHRNSISRRSVRKPQNKLPRAFTNNLVLEPLESRMLMAGLPTLIDIFTGVGASDPSNFTNVNNTVFFTANDGVRGTELWKTDGTAGGTELVKDIRPVGSSNISHLTNVNGTLFFRADDGSTGSELWKSNGTDGGTVLVKDIRPGTSFSLLLDSSFLPT